VAAVVVAAVVVAAPVVAAAAVATVADLAATAAAVTAGGSALGAGLGVSGAITLGYAAYATSGLTLAADDAMAAANDASTDDEACAEVKLCGGNGSGPTRVQNLRNTYQIGKGRNIATFDYDVDNEADSQWASSGKHLYPTANPGPNGPPDFCCNPYRCQSTR
jgi:hypothetical protein